MHQVRKDVLNGWKEIGAYLGRDPRTVERWEKQRSLPVRRLPGSGRATVYALVSELDAWLASSPVRDTPPVDHSAVVTTPALESAEAISAAAAIAERSHATPPSQGDALRKAGETFPSGYLNATSLRTGLIVATAALLVGLWAVFSGTFHPRWKVRDAAAESASLQTHRSAPVTVAGVEQLYLRGCYQTELRTPQSLRRAQEAFQAAIAKDPHYAPAYAGLANTYLLSREYGTAPDGQAFAEAKRAAQRALALDRELPGAHAAMGFVLYFGDWDVAASGQEFKTALHLDPTSALAHHWYGSALLHQGRFQESLQELTQAQRLDPSSSAILTMRAYALGLQGRRDQAEDLLDDAVRAEKTGQYHNPATMHQVLGALSLMVPRNPERFLGESLLAAQLRQDSAAVGTLRLASAAFQQGGERAMWQTLLKNEQQRHSPAERTYAIARYEAALGDNDQAMRDLNVAYTRRDPALIGLSVDPLLVGLHGDRQFAALKASMGMLTQTE